MPARSLSLPTRACGLVPTITEADECRVPALLLPEGIRTVGTSLSTSLAQGYGLHEVKQWMGHATIDTTMKHYGKWVRGDEDSRRAKDDAAFLAATPSATVVPLRSG